MALIGIMQGRLIPPSGDPFPAFPRARWSDEFSLAAGAGLDCIEWIYDVFGQDVNPLATDGGLEQLKSLSARHGVHVYSICANYFMDRPLLRATEAETEERLATLLWLLHRARLLGVQRIVLPFLDASRIQNDAEAQTVIDVVNRALPLASEAAVELHLETSLAPQPFARLLCAIPHPTLKVTYDSGNSASLGYHPRDEFAAYGDRVGSVHIKDRVRGGGSVPLGTGNADMACFFECLDERRYSGDFILEVLRAPPGHELGWARQNRKFVLQYLENKVKP